jgi:hypothetical protein
MKNMHSLFLTSTVLAATALVAACGGGGGDAPAATPIAALDGYYQGTVSSGSQFQLLALENGQFYSLVGNTDAQGVFRVTSLVEGRGISTNGTFATSSVKEFTSTGQVLSESLSATYVPKTSVAGTLTYSGSAVTFSGNVSASSNYNYETAATLSAVSGSWSGGSLYGEGQTVAISTTGAITGTSALGCQYTGTASPRASGKNVLDVTVTFGPSPCALPGQTGSGIGVSTVLASGRQQLLVALTNTDRSAGIVVFAQR